MLRACQEIAHEITAGNVRVSIRILDIDPAAIEGYIKKRFITIIAIE